LFGGVSQHDIAEALRAEEFAVEDRYVRIGDQIKRLDSYDIPVVINKDLKAEIKLWVVSDNPEDQQTEEDKAAESAETQEDQGPRIFVPKEASIDAM
ncbi:MAG: 50S ribosomal L9 C-terminal domain-containing protein, partial [Planctomycetota bacterium]